MTETMTRTDSPEVFGVYLNNEPVNVVREADHTRIVADKDNRIVGLVNLNSAKVETIQELQRLAEVRDGSLAEQRKSIREDIVDWANEYDLSIEVVNELLSTLNMDLVPEYVEAEIEVRVTVRFLAGGGTPATPNDSWLREQIEVGAVEVRPAWGSALTVEEISTDSHDVMSVVAH